ncbi:L-rhamnose-H+ transport protein [Pedobacter cryoconitis]|uniref:L-rhamnose-H+ transport protein n=1 Tax=Pedobacter cryoconitis TaxID=188932 RepID=A0A7W9DYJ8_9SPHI|nr:L-rhamnose/proton symporter RhaT [Pedobacter cryoconitis]MBB5635274.1 L-rhamnose-H+ transport protein [Pedobacter cryoconitis]
MQIIFGVIFHFIGGFASGSFYIPYKKVKGWAWESYWIVGGIFSWLIVPPLAACLTIPGFTEIIKHTNFSVIALTYFFGVLWGIGGLTFGLGVRYLGVSLGSSIILGMSSVFGALMPSIYYDFYPKAGKDTFTEIITSPWGQLVIAGLVVCIIGIILCGRAGMMKEKDLAAQQKTKESAEFKIGSGLTVAVISGLLSSCFAFGIDAGKDMAHEANNLWKAIHPGQGEFLFQNNVTYVVILWGGLTTNFLWCMLLNAKNKTFKDYTNKKTPLLSNYIFAALAGITWFLQFFFYGMGESKLGNGASSWILHMAFIILVANVWGLVLKEWKSVTRKTFRTVLAGIVFIIASILIVGYGNSIK